MNAATTQGPFLLDTSTWLRLFQRPQELSAQARDLLNAQKFFFLSYISLWEVRTQAAKGKIKLPVPVADWLQLSTPPGRVHLVDLTDEIATDSNQLPGDLPVESAERIIVATARCRHLTVMTMDERILNYPHVQSVNAS